jgi:sRNA-binding carbon storage regulator CsrA
MYLTRHLAKLGFAGANPADTLSVNSQLATYLVTIVFVFGLQDRLAQDAPRWIWPHRQELPREISNRTI